MVEQALLEALTRSPAHGDAEVVEQPLADGQVRHLLHAVTRQLVGRADPLRSSIAGLP